MLASIVFTAPAMAHAQVAGTTLLGIRYDELRDVTLGWSTKRQIIGQPVFNSQNERVGFVDDLIVAGNRAVTYAIVNAGGFVGLAKHDVAVPVSVQTDGREVDPGRHNKGGSQGKSSVRIRQ
jgi:hypothetical protein